MGIGLPPQALCCRLWCRLKLTRHVYPISCVLTPYPSGLPCAPQKVLTDTVRYYSATVALKSVTASPSSDTAPEMDLDGPISSPQSPVQEQQQQPRESASSSGAEDGKERGKEQ